MNADWVKGLVLILLGIIAVAVAIAAMLLGFGWEPTVGWGSW
jgi:hypothetical protein